MLLPNLRVHGPSGAQSMRPDAACNSNNQEGALTSSHAARHTGRRTSAGFSLPPGVNHDQKPLLSADACPLLEASNPDVGRPTSAGAGLPGGPGGPGMPAMVGNGEPGGGGAVIFCNAIPRPSMSACTCRHHHSVSNQYRSLCKADCCMLIWGAG